MTKKKIKHIDLESIDPFPEHTRLLAIKEEADIIAMFLEWLEIQEWELSDWPIEETLAKYFDINLTTIANEKEVLIYRLQADGEVTLEPVDGD